MYSYPIDYMYYEQDEIIIIAEFLSMIEEANTKRIDKNVLLKKYNIFRNIIGSISEEKTLDKEFEKLSGYSIYKTIQKYKDQ